MGRWWIVLFLFSAISFSHPLTSSDTSDWSRDWLNEHRFFQQEWQGGEKWEGSFCQAYTQFRVRVQFNLEDVRFDLQEDGHVEVLVKLKDLYGRAQGGYRSDYTFCVPLEGWTGLGAPQAEIRARVDFFDKADGGVGLKVTLRKAEIYHLNLGVPLPEFMERAVTKVFNRALRSVVESELGIFLNQKITEKLNEIISYRDFGKRFF